MFKKKWLGDLGFASAFTAVTAIVAHDLARPTPAIASNAAHICVQNDLAEAIELAQQFTATDLLSALTHTGRVDGTTIATCADCGVDGWLNATEYVSQRFFGRVSTAADMLWIPSEPIESSRQVVTVQNAAGQSLMLTVRSIHQQADATTLFDDQIGDAADHLDTATAFWGVLSNGSVSLHAHLGQVTVHNGNGDHKTVIGILDAAPTEEQLSVVAGVSMARWSNWTCALSLIAAIGAAMACFVCISTCVVSLVWCPCIPVACCASVALILGAYRRCGGNSFPGYIDLVIDVLLVVCAALLVTN